MYKKAQQNDLEGIIQVLNICGLPINDLTPDKINHFIVVKIEGKVVGTIGLEVYGEVALLRSVAVIPEIRNKGVATRLLKHIIELAKKLRITSLHLLTLTAENFFLKKGFKWTKKEFVPNEILNTTLFAEICPGKSFYMVKHL